MRSILITAAALTVAVGSASGQKARESSITIRRGEFAVAPYAGYMVTQKFFDGPLNSALNVQGSSLIGVQGSLPLAPGAALIASVGYSSGDLRAGIPLIGGISLGTSATTVYDLSTELRLENSKRFIPVFELGGGVIHRKVTVAGFSAKTTDFQVSGGVGADVPIGNNLALRFMAKDYWGKADFGSLGPLTAKTDDVHTVGLSGGLRIAF